MAIAIRKTLKAIFLVATTLAIAIGLSNLSLITTSNPPQNDQMINKAITHQKSNGLGHENEQVFVPSKRLNRFLAANPPNKGGRNPNAADHCHKDYEVCTHELGANSTCCGNKCFDLTISKHHCGSCHNKCKFTYECCRGECVDIAYDKRHCGGCNQKCLHGQYCIYAMCDYA